MRGAADFGSRFVLDGRSINDAAGLPKHRMILERSAETTVFGADDGSYDLLTVAKQALQRYGRDAPAVVRRRADELFELGDLECAFTYRLLALAVEDLLADQKLN